MPEFTTMTIDGESLFLEPWKNTKGTRYGPTDHDEYEVTIVNLSDDELAKVKKAGRQPSKAKEGSSKWEAGHKEYYTIKSLYKIRLADSATNPIEDGTFIPNGSKIRVYVEVREIPKDFQQGSTHKLLCKGVQILEMAEVPDDDWEAEGGSVFESVEGGYVSEAPQEDLPFEEVLPEEDPLA